MAAYFVVLGVLCVLPVLQAQVLYPGGCPVHPLEDDFSFDRFSGTWYELNRTLSFLKLGTSCASVDYLKADDGKMSVISRGQNFMGYTVIKPGQVMIPDPKRPAKLMVKVGRAPFWSSRMVLTTDYDNYALLWRCKNLGYILHTETLQILSRERTLDGEHQAELRRFIRENKIRTMTMRATKQTDCNNFV